MVEVECAQGTGIRGVGIDLGCKDTATDSTGHKIIGREYRPLALLLSLAQQAKNKPRVK